jgi:hypothetical protein
VTVADADQPLASDRAEWVLSAGRKQHVRIVIATEAQEIR